MRTSGNEWGVLFGQLILEILGRRGDDDATSRNGDRSQVGQGLADPGTGLNDQVTLAGQGRSDGLGHLLLTLPTFPTTGQSSRYGIEQFEGRFGRDFHDIGVEKDASFVTGFDVRKILIGIEGFHKGTLGVDRDVLRVSSPLGFSRA